MSCKPQAEGFQAGRRYSREHPHIAECYPSRKPAEDQSWPEQDVCFLDVKEAFDSVSHDSLLIACRRLGVPEPLLKYIHSLYKQGATAFKVAVSKARRSPASKEWNRVIPYPASSSMLSSTGSLPALTLSSASNMWIICCPTHYTNCKLLWSVTYRFREFHFPYMGIDNLFLINININNISFIWKHVLNILYEVRIRASSSSLLMLWI